MKSYKNRKENCIRFNLHSLIFNILLHFNILSSYIHTEIYVYIIIFSQPFEIRLHTIRSFTI